MFILEKIVLFLLGVLAFVLVIWIVANLWLAIFALVARPLAIQIQICLRMHWVRNSGEDVWMTQEQIVQSLLASPDVGDLLVKLFTRRVLKLLANEKVDMIRYKVKQKLPKKLPKDSVLHRLGERKIEELRNADTSMFSNDVTQILKGVINKGELLKAFYAYPARD